MSFFRKIADRIFPSRGPGGSGEETVFSGPIKRNQQFTSKYSKWLEKKSSKITGIIAASYHNMLINNGAEVKMGLYKDTGIEGMYISDKQLLKNDDFFFLLDYLKEKTLKQQYRLYHGITDSREERGWIRTREEYYLKPAVKNTDFPVEQKYGNITLEVNAINDQVQFLKIAATTYAGYDYKSPAPFHELVNNLFKGE